MFTYIPNLKSTTASFEAVPPWQKPSPCGGVPAGISKSDFAKWCSDAATDHVFFTLTEGLIPSVRVGRDNPPRKIHGVVGDYDSDTLVHKTDAAILVMIQTAVTKGGIHPNYMSRTFQNKIRLVWDFEKAVPGDPSELLEKTVELFKARAKLEQMLPGLDSTGLEPGHFFEQGHGWTDFGKPPVAVSILDACVFNACQKIHIKADSSVVIPMEVVSAEIESRFPGRILGDVQVGTRVPLFWIPDGIQRMGGIVVESGVVCYSDRVGSGLTTWRNIFGDSFVRGYEERMVSSVLDRFAYDGTRYWVKAANGRWYDHPKENITPRLKKAGFSDKTSKGQCLSPVEETVLSIQDNRRIDAVAPFLYNFETLVNRQEVTFLNISRTRAMSPAGTGQTDPETHWPFIHDYIMDFLDPDPAYPVDPIHYLLSWMKYFWESALAGDPQPGQMVVVAGGRDAGKTLFGKHILGPMLGGHDDATKFVLGLSEFNKDLPHKGVWRIDDSSPPDSDSDHSRYSDRIKALVANMECPYRAMYKDNVTVPWMGRIFLTCNLNADAQGILPKLSETMMDKIMLFKARDREPGFFPPKTVLEAVIAAELPYFLEWLHKDYVIPAEVTPQSHRFGVSPYHHHEIVGVVREQSPEQNLADLLDIWAEEHRTMSPDATVWSGNPTQLMIELSSDHYRTARPASARHANTMLKKLRENGHWRIQKWNNKARANVYSLSLEPKQ